MKKKLFNRKKHDEITDDTFSSFEETPVENIINQRNAEEFDNIMSNASRKTDGFWDKNNIMIRILTFIIWVFAIIGVLYYLFIWFSSK